MTQHVDELLRHSLINDNTNGPLQPILSASRESKPHDGQPRRRMDSGLFREHAHPDRGCQHLAQLSGASVAEGVEGPMGLGEQVRGPEPASLSYAVLKNERLVPDSGQLQPWVAPPPGRSAKSAGAMRASHPRSPRLAPDLDRRPARDRRRPGHGAEDGGHASVPTTREARSTRSWRTAEGGHAASMCPT